MNRRDTALALLALGAAPLVSFAQQQGKVWRIGFLAASRRPDAADSHFYGAFPKRLHELGYVEGKNLIIEWRSADGSLERFPALAAELVRLKVDVIVAPSTQAISAAHKATATIPIVMGSAGDPVGSGFVKSLAHPGANITGRSNFSVDISPKWLEMLLSVVPKLSRVAVLFNPTNSGSASTLKSIQAAAQKAKLTILPVELRAAQDAESAFSSITANKAGALVVLTDSLFTAQDRKFAELAVKHRLPTIGPFREYAEAGFLMSYGHNRVAQYRRVAEIVDKILKGANPADIPVEQPTTFEFFVNLKTAKVLGLSIPQSVLLRADEVIK